MADAVIVGEGVALVLCVCVLDGDVVAVTEPVADWVAVNDIVSETDGVGVADEP